MISNSGMEGAREIIGRLRTNDLLPLCPRGGTGNVPVEASPLPSPVTEAPAGADATDTTGVPTTTGTPLPDKPSEPGVDCRTVS
jgi:protein phosphatase